MPPELQERLAQAPGRLPTEPQESLPGLMALREPDLPELLQVLPERPELLQQEPELLVQRAPELPESLGLGIQASLERPV